MSPASPPPSAHDPDCPFCSISQTYAPMAPAVSVSPSAKASSTATSAFATPSNKTSKEPEAPESETAYTILSTPHVLAFLDHMPIGRGHCLLTTRQHRQKMSDVTVAEAAVLGAWLAILSRAVMRAIGSLKDWDGTGVPESISPGAEEDGNTDAHAVQDWNLVQNNGARAAQVVNHVHYHIIPRTGAVPELKNRSWTMFGRGQRGDLDEDEARIVRDRIRTEIAREVARLSSADRRVLGIDGGAKL